MARTTIAHTVEVRHDGTGHTVTVAELPVFKCAKCNSVIFGMESEERVSRALRDQLGLLHPDEITTCRKDLDLRQRDLASALGIAAESLSRWESGAMIQSRASDRLLRGYFGVPEYRDLLASLPGDRSLGATVMWHGAAYTVLEPGKSLYATASPSTAASYVPITPPLACGDSPVNEAANSNYAIAA